jgi:hypothetical protein
MLREYHVIYSFQYYPRFHLTAVGLGKYYPWIRGHYWISDNSHFLRFPVEVTRVMFHVLTPYQEPAFYWFSYFVFEKNTDQIQGQVFQNFLLFMKEFKDAFRLYQLLESIEEIYLDVRLTFLNLLHKIVVL